MKAVNTLIVIAVAYFGGQLVVDFQQMSDEYDCTFLRQQAKRYQTSAYQLNKDDSMILVWQEDGDRRFMFRRDGIDVCLHVEDY